jgi:hypothetical protein
VTRAAGVIASRGGRHRRPRRRAFLVRSESIFVARAKSAVLEVSVHVAWPSIFVCRVRTSVRAAKSPVGSVGNFVHDAGERLLGASNFVYRPDRR